MRYQEALRALAAGRCTLIARGGDASERFKLSGLHVVEADAETALTNSHWLLADDWYMVDPVPVYEERKITRWMCSCCGAVSAVEGIADNCCGKLGSPIELTGVEVVEVRPKLKLRVEVTECQWHKTSNGAIPMGNLTGDLTEWCKLLNKTGHLTFEWEEEQ